MRPPRRSEASSSTIERSRSRYAAVKPAMPPPTTTASTGGSVTERPPAPVDVCPQLVAQVGLDRRLLVLVEHLPPARLQGLVGLLAAHRLEPPKHLNVDVELLVRRDEPRLEPPGRVHDVVRAGEHRREHRHHRLVRPLRID